MKKLVLTIMMVCFVGNTYADCTSAYSIATVKLEPHCMRGKRWGYYAGAAATLIVISAASPIGWASLLVGLVPAGITAGAIGGICGRYNGFLKVRRLIDQANTVLNTNTDFSYIENDPGFKDFVKLKYKLEKMLKREVTQYEVAGAIADLNENEALCKQKKTNRMKRKMAGYVKLKRLVKKQLNK